MKNLVYKILAFISIIMTFLINYIFIYDKIEVESYKLYFIIYNFIICLFIAILIHELGHQLISVILGINSSVLYIFPFLMVKNNSRWDISVNIKYMLQYGGFNIPNIPIVRNNKEYDVVVKKIAISTIFGPIASIMVAGACSFFQTNIDLLILIRNIFCITSLFIGVYNLFFGDGQMFFSLLKNEKNTINILMSFNHYSNNYSNNDYLYIVAKKKCEEINLELIDKNELIQIEIQCNIIENSIIKNKFINNEVVKKNIKNLIYLYYKLDIIHKEIIYYIHLVIIYLLVIEKDFNSANKLYKHYFLEYENSDDTNYLLERTKYFLGYPISLEKIMHILENNMEHYINENYINVEKNILKSYCKNK
ncbi:hypothetical protein [Clostridium paridis]|uniref:M50 family metallopeptidase n=1 Tax=Clostridium paridis TaxID=2803863 RepID=A0A937FGE8_9CLOT|nr:hypothetical protein [Clostridium paridis]MBL4931802.1 hypothetical protein [Clostridium paridis]